MRSFFSVILVSIQFGCLIYLLISGPVFNPDHFASILELLSIILGLWSIVVMQSSKMNVFPELRRGSTLIKSGPYKIIRHPMYLAVILFALSLFLMQYSIIRLLILLVLGINLVIKIEFEERILEKELNEYRNYKLNTYKLIPFLY